MIPTGRMNPGHQAIVRAVRHKPRRSMFWSWAFYGSVLIFAWYLGWTLGEAL